MIMAQQQKKQQDEKPADIEQKSAEVLLEKAQIEASEYKQKYLRALADYQNYEKRMIEDRKRIMNMAHAEVLMRLLPIFDTIEKADIFVKDPGLKMVVAQLQTVLGELGVKEIPVVGKEFDPYMAEAIESIPSDKDNIVLEVVSKGYEYQGQVIRPAKVKVGKKVTHTL